jgi:hypothetical protein
MANLVLRKQLFLKKTRHRRDRISLGCSCEVDGGCHKAERCLLRAQSPEVIEPVPYSLLSCCCPLRWLGQIDHQQSKRGAARHVSANSLFRMGQLLQHLARVTT